MGGDEEVGGEGFNGHWKTKGTIRTNGFILCAELGVLGVANPNADALVYEGDLSGSPLCREAEEGVSEGTRTLEGVLNPSDMMLMEPIHFNEI